MLQAVLSIAVPVVLNSFLQTMYNLTDTYWLGKIGTEQLAAINLVTPVQNIILNFGTGITVAGSVLIAQYIGARDDKNAKSMANQIFACAMLFAIACAGICFLQHLPLWDGLAHLAIFMAMGILICGLSS